MGARVGEGPEEYLSRPTTTRAPEDLADLAMDEVLGEAVEEIPGSDVPWETAVRRTARRSYAAVVAHPWAVEVAGARPLVGPNALTLWGRIGTAQHEYGARDEELAMALRGLSFLMLGAAMTAASPPTDVSVTPTTLDDATNPEVFANVVPHLDNVYFDQVLDLVIEGIKARWAGE